MSEWEVPGYALLELLGFGTTGEVWRARDRGSGEVVVLRRLAGGNRAAVAEVRRQATVVRSLATSHLVRLRTSTRAGCDDVLVLDHAAGGSLAALLATRGVLEPGEVVTVLAPLAEALGQAHAHDLVHRRLGASSVLLGADGRPLLDGLGLDALHDPADGLDPTGALGPTADVWALGALGHLLLTGEPPGEEPLSERVPTAPRPLVRALEEALAFDPAARPTAPDLAAALLAACPAAPLAGVRPAAVPDAEPHWPRALSRLRWARSGLGRSGARGWSVGLVAALSVAVVMGAGWAWGTRSAPATASVHPAPRPATPDWASVLGQLDEARATAYAASDPAALADVYAPASPLLAADRQTLQRLRHDGRSVTGLRHAVEQLRVLRLTADGVLLRVRESLSGHAVLQAGTVLLRVPAAAAVDHDVLLVRTAMGWRVQTVQSRAAASRSGPSAG